MPIGVSEIIKFVKAEIIMTDKLCMLDYFNFCLLQP